MSGHSATSRGPDLRGKRGLTWLALFTTTGTLVCCALPITLVTLGLGATVAAMTSTFPFLITLSQHKVWVFAISALMLALAGWAMFRPGRACPADAELGRALGDRLFRRLPRPAAAALVGRLRRLRHRA